MRRRGAEDGAIAVEFALLGPLLIVMILGICAYGGYFWMSHSVQQLANDAARAALGGLDTTERQSLAQQVVTSEALTYPSLDGSRIHLSLVDTTTQLTVNVAYDASGSPFWAAAGLVPMPSTTFTRSATIKLGGY
jgi:Flp pilus assembly protein TadG